MKFAKLKKAGEKSYKVDESNDVGIYSLASFLTTEIFKDFHYDNFIDWLNYSDSQYKDTSVSGLVYGLREKNGYIHVWDCLDRDEDDNFMSRFITTKEEMIKTINKWMDVAKTIWVKEENGNKIELAEEILIKEENGKIVIERSDGFEPPSNS